MSRNNEGQHDIIFYSTIIDLWLVSGSQHDLVQQETLTSLKIYKMDINIALAFERNQ